MSPSPSPAPPGPPRRTLLTAGIGLTAAASTGLLAGCGSGADSASAAGRPGLDARVRARAAEDSKLLLARYTAVADVHPALTGQLDPMRRNVERHLRELAGNDARAGSQPSPAPSTVRGTPPPAVDVPGTKAAALSFLADSERTVADRREQALVEAPAQTARLLASLAAAGSSHVYLLTKGR